MPIKRHKKTAQGLRGLNEFQAIIVFGPSYPADAQSGSGKNQEDSPDFLVHLIEKKAAVDACPIEADNPQQIEHRQCGNPDKDAGNFAHPRSRKRDQSRAEKAGKLKGCTFR